MTDKLYYDDPLIAAYIAREFGVELISSDTGIPKTDRYYNWNICKINGNPERDAIAYFANLAVEGKFYIHPDSLDIFKPQVGDIGQRKNQKDVVHYNSYNKQEGWYIKKNGAVFEDDYIQIIQRDGKPFFMPKIEE